MVIEREVIVIKKKKGRLVPYETTDGSKDNLPDQDSNRMAPYMPQSVYRRKNSISDELSDFERGVKKQIDAFLDRGENRTRYKNF